MKRDLHPSAASLPAAGIADAVNRKLAEAARLVVTAPPGAGKSTLLPLTILEALPEGSRILMLEPRRLAARQVAERMAFLLGESVGKTVGYRIRFETRISRETRIEVLTEGILSRMLVEDPTLEGVSAVLFDEFHERSLHSDVSLALTRQAQDLLRPDLKIVILSATLDAAALCRSLGAESIDSEGKMFPVQVFHLPEPEDPVAAVSQVIRQVHREEGGDILAFLPGEAEIRRCAQRIGDALEPTHVRPLYGMLSNQEQQAAIAPSRPGERKIVLATPIAETSLTIEGVRTVIDSGLCKKLVFSPQSGLSHLETVRISRDMADQRSGRAGRVAPGKCYRLWSTATQARMAATRMPEILDADLASMVLEIAAWGENRPERLPWLTPPPPAHLAQARQLLEALDAVDGEGRITPHGKRLAALPCHPRIAQMLCRAGTAAQKALAADIAAILEEKDPLADTRQSGLDLRVDALRRARGRREEGKWNRLIRSAEQYRNIVHAAVDDSLPDPYEIGALLAAAYPERIGRTWPEGQGCFRLAGGELAALDPADPLAGNEWIAAADLSVGKEGTGRIFLAAPVSVEDLRPLARQRDNIFWDSKAGRVVARREERIGGLLLSEKPLSEASGQRTLDVLCQAAVKDGTSMFDFSEAVLDLQRRVATVAAWHPELDLPDLGTQAVLERAPQWLPAFAGNATTVPELKKIDLCNVLWSLLDYPQQQTVDRLAPTHLAVPTGSRIRLEYRQGAEVPVLRVRLQECFGLLDTPCVDDGRRPVLMELLSPGYKSVQLTTDLRSFWNGTYFEVRKELRRRYPKHAWPDNPLAADPVRGIRRKN
ncbi:MAG: ATP-dependent helicase HrpB [Bacteroidales bacterium]|nr:ATP-dependent helicase HrpB [Bacteroidales bacterium]